MNHQQAFCVQCGQPLSPGVSFCRSCGVPVASQTAASAPSGQISADPQAQQRRRPNVILMLVGFLLILTGLIQPAAHLFGQETTASIAEINQRIDGSSDQMDYNYRITYAFSVDGKQYTGNYQMNKVFNVSNLPKEGSSLVIKYIAMMPGFNTPANRGNPFLFLLFVGGLGVLLLVIGFKGRTAVRK